MLPMNKSSALDHPNFILKSYDLEKSYDSASQQLPVKGTIFAAGYKAGTKSPQNDRFQGFHHVTQQLNKAIDYRKVL